MMMMIIIIIILIIIINEKCDAKQDAIQHTKARLREFLKKKWKTK